MPGAREALLNAALAALAGRPWSGVRMVDVAGAAGVSRQTLYNEFGSKEGLARALVRREADAFLRGVERILSGRPPQPYRPGSHGHSRGHSPDPAHAPNHSAPDHSAPDRLASVAEWIVAEAANRPVLRALLTGSWNERLPAPRPARPGAFASGVPAQRRADAGTPAPAELVAATLAHADAGTAPSCELAVRLALSYIVAPGPQAVGQVVRSVLSGRSPTAGDR